MMFPYPLDSGLSLELLAPRHAQELFDAVDANREHLRPWMPWIESTNSVDDISAFISTTLSQVSSDSGFQTAIRSGETIIGVVGMHRIDWANRSTSLGYWLAKDAQGKGIMTKACTAYIDHSFSGLNLHRLEIRCATGNARSRAVPERLGFANEGVVREVEWVNGRFLDHVIYGLVANEWSKRSRSS
jgi:ribosomal-protein-serine acetyltransferase